MVSFPYLKERVKGGYVLRPKIPITISHKGNRIETLGAIDSGSDITIVPRELAKTLGIEIKGREKEISGIGGGVLKVVSEYVNIKVAEYLIPQARIHIPIEKSQDVDVVILGREPLFQEFNITFEENKKRVTLTKVRH